MEFPQDVGQDGRHREPREGDPQPPDPALGDGLHVRRDAHEGGEHRLDLLDKRGARRGQLHPAAGAGEQPGAKGRLQLRDLAAERGLGDRERLGGLPEMEPASDLAEIDEVAQLERELILPGHHW